MVAPDSKQCDSVVDLGVLPQPSTCLAAAPSLEATQKCGLTIRCIPELPSHNAGAVPCRILVWPGAPQILMPAESINRLPADATEARTQAVGALSVRSRWGSECRRQPSFWILADPPGPAERLPTSSS